MINFLKSEHLVFGACCFYVSCYILRHNAGNNMLKIVSQYYNSYSYCLCHFCITHYTSVYLESPYPMFQRYLLILISNIILLQKFLANRSCIMNEIVPYLILLQSTKRFFLRVVVFIIFNEYKMYNRVFILVIRMLEYFFTCNNRKCDIPDALNISYENVFFFIESQQIYK